MNTFMEGMRSIWPVLLGSAYFFAICVLVECWVVRKRALNDYQLKLLDFVWACAAAMQLAFLLLSVREGFLRDRIDTAERLSAAEREVSIDKMNRGVDECMDGTWPQGALRGKSFDETGGYATEACAGVGFTLNFVSRFFHDELLWLYTPSPETGMKFARSYETTFVGEDFEREFLEAWTPTRKITAVTLKARQEMATHAQKITSWKQEAGHASFEKAIVHSIAGLGLYWPIVVATSLAFSFGKARIAIIEAKQRRARADYPASIARE